MVANAQSGEVNVARRPCGFSVKPYKVSAVKIRTKPSASSTAVGVLYRGHKLTGADAGNWCAVKKGGWYSGCGKRDRYWSPVWYKSHIRYVGRNCVTIAN
jgi:hypothetical protein